MEPEEMSEQAKQLIYSFCERRNFTALRQILRGYPIGGGGLTDDWAQSLEALKSLREWCSESLSPEEVEAIDNLIIELDRIVYRRSARTAFPKNQVDEILAQTQELVNSWCESRNIGALGTILAGWPVGPGLTEDWEKLMDALKMVRSLRRDALDEETITCVDNLIIMIDRLLNPSDFKRIFPTTPESD